MEVISSEPQGNFVTMELHINFTQVSYGNNTFLNEWTVNNEAYHANYSESLLSMAQAGPIVATKPMLVLFAYLGLYLTNLPQELIRLRYQRNGPSHSL